MSNVATVQTMCEAFGRGDVWTLDDAGKVTGMRHVVDTAKHIKAAKGSLAGVT